MPFYLGKRAQRNVHRKSFHLLFTKRQWEKLEKLSFDRQLTAADVIRQLIEKAK
jgi:hypothetical protein